MLRNPNDLDHLIVHFDVFESEEREKPVDFFLVYSCQRTNAVEIFACGYLHSYCITY